MTHVGDWSDCANLVVDGGRCCDEDQVNDQGLLQTGSFDSRTGVVLVAGRKWYLRQRGRGLICLLVTYSLSYQTQL